MNVGEGEEAARETCDSTSETTTRTQNRSKRVHDPESERIGVEEAGRGVGDAVNRDLGGYLDPLAAEVEQLDLDAKVGQRLNVVGRRAGDDVAVGAEERETVDPFGERRCEWCRELDERAGMRVQREGKGCVGIACGCWRGARGRFPGEEAESRL